LCKERRRVVAGEAMKIQIKGASDGVTDGLRTKIVWSLLLNLSRFGDRIERVTVRLSDEVSALGVVGKRCWMDARLKCRANVAVETIDGPAAIDRAIARLAERVARTLADGRSDPDPAPTPMAHTSNDKATSLRRRRRRRRKAAAGRGERRA
jgi:hypothetical protein